MKGYLVGLMVIVFMVSGCVGSSNQDPGTKSSNTTEGSEETSVGQGNSALPANFNSISDEKKYSSLANRSSNSTYHVEYGMNFEAGLDNELITESIENAEVDLYSYEGSIKSLVTISVMGTTSTTATFPMEDSNRLIQCKEIIGLSSGSVSCSLSANSTGGTDMMATSPSQDFTEKLDKVDVSYEGMKTIAGRECASFDLAMPSDLLNRSNVEGEVLGHFCIDQEKGYMARMAVDMTTKTSGLGEKRDVHLGFNAMNYDTAVSKNDVEVPKDVIVDLKCRNDMKARIYAYEYSGDLDISINNESKQEQIVRGKIRNFNLTESRVGGTNTLNVTAGEKTYSDTCFHLKNEDEYGLL